MKAAAMDKHITASKMQHIYTEAKAAGDAAVKNSRDSMPCGFAWIVIKPARGDFVKYCKANKIGKTDEYAGGYRISSYDACAWHGQNMDVKIQGCQAFVDVLVKNSINAYVDNRMD